MDAITLRVISTGLSVGRAGGVGRSRSLGDTGIGVDRLGIVVGTGVFGGSVG
jgi:hypothetical protein